MAFLYCLLCLLLGGLGGALLTEQKFYSRRERVNMTLITLQELQEFLCQVPDSSRSFDEVESTRQLVTGMKRL